MNAEARQRIERRIAKAAAVGLVAAGYQIAVHDGEEIALKKTSDVGAILDAMFSTDEDRFLVYRESMVPGESWERAGWVQFIHGNGVDVLSDYTTNLEAAMQRADELADQLERRHG